MDWHAMNQTAWKSLLRFIVSGREQKIGSQKTKKKLKPTRESYFTHLPGRPHWGDCFELWLAGSYRRCNYPCQILWQSVQKFRSSDTPNFAILHRNSWSPLQQCKHYSAYTVVYRATLWYWPLYQYSRRRARWLSSTVPREVDLSGIRFCSFRNLINSCACGPCTVCYSQNFHEK